MDDAVLIDASANRFAQSVFSHVRHDLGIDAIASFEHPKDDRLAPGATASLAANTSGTEIGLVDFDFPPEGALSFTVLGDVASEFEVDAVGRADRKPRELGCVGCREVHRECPDQTTENLLTDSGTDVVLVFNGIHRASVTLLTS